MTDHAVVPPAPARSSPIRLTRRALGAGLAAIALCPSPSLAAFDERGGRLGIAAPDSATGHVAIVWPPAGRAPWLVAAFYPHPDAHGATRNATLADAARSVVAAFG